MSSSLSKRWVCYVVETYLGFSLWIAFFTFVGSEGIYSIGERWESHT